MGYIRDHAIVVIGTHGDWIGRAHAVAVRIFPWVSPISPPAMNGSRAFFIPPDGSREGWEDSDTGDERRDEFITVLSEWAHEDGSSPLCWAEVRVSDDNHDLCIERSYVDLWHGDDDHTGGD